MSEVNLSENAAKVLELIEGMSILEAADLVKAMEDKFGVSAAAPVAVAAVAGRRRRRRGQGRVQRHADRCRRQEDPGHQGRPGHHRPGPEGSQGTGRERPDRRQGRPCTKDEAEEIKAKLEEVGAIIDLK